MSVTGARLTLNGGSDGGLVLVAGHLHDQAVAAHVAWMRLRALSEYTVALRVLALRLLARHGGRPVLELDREQLHAWQQSLGISAAARRAYIVQVCAFYRWAAAEGLRPDDPSTVLVRPKVRRGVPRPIAEDDLARAIAAAAEPIRCWLVLAAYEGLRACELAWLERADVLEGERLMIVRGKGDKERVLPLGDAALEAMLGYGLPRRGLVFRDRNGRGYRPVVVSNRANRHLHGAGIEATLHQCRHRFGTQTLDVVGDLRIVQELLGHSSPATTAVYTRVSSIRAAEAVAGLDRLRGGGAAGVAGTTTRSRSSA